MKKYVIKDSIVSVLIISILLLVNIPYLKIVLCGIIVLIYAGLTGGVKDRLGFSSPKNWKKICVLGLFFGLIMVALSHFILIPLIAQLTGATLQLDSFQQIKGNPTILYSSLVIGWVIGGFYEEIIFRAFLLNSIIQLKDSIWINLAGVIFTSILFGYLHSYQGLTGQMINAIAGACLAIMIILNKRSIWLNIIAHGMVNTISMLCIYTGLIQV